MTSSIRIVSTSSMDSSPSIVITGGSGSGGGILFNCGEGCQRTFVDSRSLRLSTISTICLGSIHHTMMGGLPGTLLTIIDVERNTAMVAAAATTLNKSTTSGTRRSFSSQELESSPSQAQQPAPNLQIIGPIGTKQYISALRHFMRRDAYQYTIYEGNQQNISPIHIPPSLSSSVSSVSNKLTKNSKNNSKKKKNDLRSSSSAEETNHHNYHQSNGTAINTKLLPIVDQRNIGFTIQSIVFSDDHGTGDEEDDTHNNDTNNSVDALNIPPPLSSIVPTSRKRSYDVATDVSSISIGDTMNDQPDDKNSNNNNDDDTNDVQPPISSPQQSCYVSYIVRTPPIPGKFLTHKAMALGVPKGPLYGQLKSGHDVTIIVNDEHDEKTMTLTKTCIDDETQQQSRQRQVVIRSIDVVEPPTPPIVIMILYYPTERVAQQLFTCESLQPQSQPTTTSPELVIHITSPQLFHQYGKSHWTTKTNQNDDGDGTRSTKKNIDHIFLPLYDPITTATTTTSSVAQEHTMKYTDDTASIAESTCRQSSAMLGAYARSLLHSDIYICPQQYRLLPQQQRQQLSSTIRTPPAAIPCSKSGGDDNTDGEYHIGYATMEYTILPRSKRGFVTGDDNNNNNNNNNNSRSSCDTIHTAATTTISVLSEEETMRQLVETTGALPLVKQCIQEYTTIEQQQETRKPVTNGGISLGIQQRVLSSSFPSSSSGRNGELIFTGTASAVPCKHRNVTGMLLKQPDQRSIILDIGEGTMGQLLRMRLSSAECYCESSSSSSTRVSDIYHEIKAVWISHPHADHHLGLIRLLKDRRQFVKKEKLLIIAPTPLFRFLNEIAVIDSEISDTYIGIDCRDLVGESSEFLFHQQMIHDTLGITRCRAVPVTHCAHAYAIVLDGTGFGTVVYSGDCRPSTQLATIAKGADVLIHESTFENDMQADAVVKRHSTIDEALHVGQQMECKCIVLTHFSQRYSKVPPLPLKSDAEYPFPVIYAYDWMRLQPQTLLLASKLTPALRLLFADDTDNSHTDAADGQYPVESIGAKVLSIPGAFANASLL